jgi:leucyl-tRNA synthetase
MQKYNPQKIEKKWQKYWLAKKTFVAKDFSKKKKKYVLVEFPYPSGAGLHMGHLRPYVAADVFSRFNRLQGKETIFPIGWDAFGLPAENYAIKNKVHPSVSTKKNVAAAKKQLESWGMSFDWSREVNTTDPSYYKWTQWIFLQFYKAGLAYEKTGLINWCPKDKTGLANEEVIDGKCERCGTVVEKKELKQWYLKITKYAEKLLEGLKHLPDWPEPVKIQQENWIGKSEGLEEFWQVEGMDLKLATFTTWPHTTWGATFMVIAPEHPVIEKLVNGTEYEQGAKEFIEKCIQEKIKDPLNVEKKKDGFFLGRHVINHLTGWKMPLFVANFAIMDYGTGIVKCTPTHDQRDFEFARTFNLPFIQVVAEETGTSKVGEERRDGGCGVIFNPQTQKYAAASSSDGLVRLFAGGVEGAEDLEKGILREITEESGLHDFLHVEKIRTCYAHFHNARKNVDRVAMATCYLVVLKSESIHGRKLEEHEKDLNLAWFSADEILENWKSNNQDGGLNHWISFLKNAVGRAISLEFDKTSDKLKYVNEAYTGEGVMINAGKFTGMNSVEGRKAIAGYTVQKGEGKYAVNYKLRDWVFSRQRYWGEPIPIVHCEKCGVVPVPDKDLPVKLPPVKKYEPTGTGESPLAAVSKWVNTKCPNCKGPAKRETNTMPQWAGSSWYWLRYTDPKNKKFFADIKKQKYWTPVDVYFGGMEHTTLHLLYSRFWNLFLYDQKLVTTKEPYTLRKPHGIILAADGEKMSKSRGNVVNPDVIVKSHGADTLRMYELFLGPHETTVSWNDQGISGVKRFLDRVWVWVGEQSGKRKAERKDSPEVEKAIHKLIKKVTEDIEGFHFNTAISSFMEFYNQVKDEAISEQSMRDFLVLLYPFAPHIVEELNQILAPRLRSGFSRNKKSVQLEKWPKFDPKKIIDSTADIIIQVNGKVKGKITVEAGSNEEAVKNKAMELESVKNTVGSAPIKRAIYVPNRILNLVI